VIGYGVFVNAVTDFLIVAIVIFFLVRGANRLMAKPKQATAAPATRECPYCFSAISIKASRCPHCTSQVSAA
jgi:large conductance mechanosensitive channel